MRGITKLLFFTIALCLRLRTGSGTANGHGVQEFAEGLKPRDPEKVSALV